MVVASVSSMVESWMTVVVGADGLGHTVVKDGTTICSLLVRAPVETSIKVLTVAGFSVVTVQPSAHSETVRVVAEVTV